MNKTKETFSQTIEIKYESSGLQLTGLIIKPDSQEIKKFPAVLFLHGNGSDCWHSGWWGHALAQHGFAVFIPSQIGYPHSEGKPDFCGPQTVKGVMDGMSIFLEKEYIDKTKVGIWGISRGAKVAAIIATKAPALFAAGVFQSGGYEMQSDFETTKIEGIKEVMLKEIGGDPQGFRVRSPIYDMENLSFPVLILHGEDDDRVNVEQARMLDKKLIELNKPHETVILKDYGHMLTKATRDTYTIPFLEKYLKN